MLSKNLTVWPSYQPLVKPVCPCVLADMVCAMPVMAAVDDTEPEEASAVPDTAASRHQQSGQQEADLPRAFEPDAFHYRHRLSLPY